MQADEKRQRIIERIRKLQDMQSENSGAFQGEISNASSLMQKLMDEYSISQMEIDASGNDEIDKGFQKVNSDVVLFTILHWHWQLARLVARITHTRHYSSIEYSEKAKPRTAEWNLEKNPKLHDKKRKENSYRTIGFFGDATNVSIANELYYEWIIKIDAMSGIATDEYAKIKKEKQKYVAKELELDFKKSSDKIVANEILGIYSAHPRIFRRSWIEGCLSAMNRKVSEQEEDREAKIENAIVLYDNKVNSAFKKLSENWHKVNIGGNTKHSSLGYSMGEVAGSKMDLSHKKKIKNSLNLLEG